MKTKHVGLIALIFIPTVCFGIHKIDMTGCNIPTSDYGILTSQEKIPNKKFRWQCFPTQEIIFNLFDYVKSEDRNWNKVSPDIRTGELIITGFTNGKSMRLECQGRNEYTLPQNLSAQAAEQIFHHLQNVIKNKKYVCIYGKYSSNEIIFNGTQPLDNWIFEKIRAKNRCFSYDKQNCT